jgi:hypothetical protein
MLFAHLKRILRLGRCACGDRLAPKTNSCSPRRFRICEKLLSSDLQSLPRHDRSRIIDAVPGKTALDLQHSLVDIPQIDAIADFINDISQHLPLGRPTTGELSGADAGRALLTFSSGHKSGHQRCGFRATTDAHSAETRATALQSWAISCHHWRPTSEWVAAFNRVRRL